MININLLPAEKLQKTLLIKQNLGFLVFCLSMLIILVIIIIVLIGVKYTLKTKIDGLNSNIETAQSALNSYQEIKLEVFFIKDRLKELAALQDKATPWSQNVEELTKVTPVDIQLTEFSIDTKASKDKLPIKITGLSLSQETIVRFQQQLEVSDYFQEVTFTSSGKISKDDQEYWNFTLYANLEEVKP